MTITNGTTPVAVHTNGSNGSVAEHIGAIRSTDIVGEMQVAYLDYAMSVIVARALPDVRDGLKPVHRRILYAMYADLGLTHDKPHKKSARIVGEVLGKYHPHGDVAVYDAMARMAQDFSLRYPLVDGQGNFGSIDGDSPAAMRYTEARLAEISQLIIEDLDKDTVSWNPNFDNTLEEPAVLPAALPNLLINGANGIAVGMATNIPPHNLGEVVDALAYLIDHFDKVDDVTADDLLRFVQGPDFPTGGIVYRYRVDNKSDEETDAIAQGYSVGKSRLVMQAKAHFEELSRGRSRIIITELPYQTNKSTLIERIADLVRDERLTGISDLRDESDRTGMRVVIELSRTAEPKDVLAALFKYTPLQQTFGMQMLALVDGQPRLLGLKRMLQLFIHHRQEIVRRRSEFDLARARERAHIVEGLLKALDILDEVISTIRNSQRVDTARANLVKNFGFSEVQAQAILDMQLRRLAAMERSKLKDEFKELKERIAYLEDLLAHPEKILAVIKAELLAIKEKHGDARRTQIVDRAKGALTTTDLLPDETVWVSVNGKGDLRRQIAGKVNNTALRQTGRASDVAVVTANTREPLYLFTADGRGTRVAVHEIPADGGNKHVSDLCRLARGDALAAALTIPKTIAEGDKGGYLCLVTEQGMVKRVTLADFIPATIGAPTVIGINGKDRLGWVFVTRGNQDLLLVTASGQAIRFSEEDVRSMGLPAAGVGGVKLKKGDKVVYAAAVDPSGVLITLSTHGFAKYSPLSEYPSQGRNGGGIVTHKLTDRTGPLCAALLTGVGLGSETLLAVSRKGVPKLVAFTDIPAMGRGVQGKVVLETTANDAVVQLQRLLDSNDTPPVTPTDGDSAPSRTEPEPAAPAPPNVEKAVAPARPPASTGGKVALKANDPATMAKRVMAKPEAVHGKANGAAPATADKRTLAVKGQQSNGKAAPVPLKKAGATQRDGALSPARKPAAEDSTQSALAKTDQQASLSASGVTPEKSKVKAAGVMAKAPASGQADQKGSARPAKIPAPDPSAAKPETGPATPPRREQPPAKTPAPVTVETPARTEPVTQAPLFNVEPVPEPVADKSKVKKVEAVVSVPAGQVRKKNR